MDRDLGTWVRRFAGSLAGAVIGTGAYLVLDDGRLSLPASVLLVAVLLCLVPSGRSLSGRIAINGVAVLGFLPLLWTFTVFGSLNHGALAVAIVIGLLVARVAAAPEPAGAARSLLPSARPADLLLVPSILAAVTWSWRLFSVRRPAQAVEALLPGFDHVAHFDMFNMMWRHGVSIGDLGPSPDGTSWEYGKYPAGFHALAATLAQLTGGVRPPGPGAAVVTFAHVDAVLVCAGTVVITACLVSLLARPRVLPLLAPVTLLLTALLWLPGGQVLWHGFENFWLAAVLCSCALLLAARAFLHGSVGVGVLVAVLGAAVGTTLNWVPLMCVAWVGPVVVLVLWWRGRPAGRHQVAGLLVCAVAVLIGLRTAFDLTRSTGVSTLIDASGGIEASPNAAIALMLLLFGGLSFALGNGPGGLHDAGLRRLRWVGLGIACGVVVTTLFAWAQRSSTGKVDYYAIKLSLGVLLAAACWVAAMLAVVLDRVLPAAASGARVTWVRVPLVLLGCLVCTQLLGYMTLAEADQQARRPVPRDFAGHPVDYRAMARGIVAAASSARPGEGFRAQYLAMGDAHCYSATLPNAWFHALTETFTVRATAQGATLSYIVYTPADAAKLLRFNLKNDPTVVTLVDADHAAEVKRLLGPALGTRVRAFSPLG